MNSASSTRFQFATAVVPESDQLPKGQTSDSVLGNIIDERYFDTMNMSLARGRTFTADDKEDSRRVPSSTKGSPKPVGRTKTPSANASV
jgi:hypothetical protein